MIWRSFSALEKDFSHIVYGGEPKTPPVLTDPKISPFPIPKTTDCLWVVADFAAHSSFTVMASNPQNEPRASREVEKPPIEPIRPPTVEEMRSQDIWSNCAIRSVVSGVMGYYQFSADSNSTLQNGTGTLFGTELEVTMWWKSYSDWI